MSAADELKRRYKFLYHMAALGSWKSILTHGLLSTSALLDLFEVFGTQRIRLESEHRPQSVSIEHSKYGIAVVRDQKPMSDSGLQRALQNGITPTDWYRTLNGKAFFWLTIERLEKMLNANAYKNDRHIALTVDAAGIVDAYKDSIELALMNTGCTKPYPHPRGIDTFQPLISFSDENWRRKEPVVELTVNYSVPDIAAHVISVHEVGANKTKQLVWKRE